MKCGKKADIIFIKTDKIHLCPENDVCANIVYSANGADVAKVMIDGKILPKITGYGDEFKDWLTLLAKICSNNALYQSENILKDIIASGENQMKYYQFF